MFYWSSRSEFSSCSAACGEGILRFISRCICNGSPLLYAMIKIKNLCFQTQYKTKFVLFISLSSLPIHQQHSFQKTTLSCTAVQINNTASPFFQIFRFFHKITNNLIAYLPFHQTLRENPHELKR